ncbi:hypothetical protein F442_11346, partial [Phytophthora nicotianae P10297]
MTQRQVMSPNRAKASVRERSTRLDESDHDASSGDDVQGPDNVSEHSEAAGSTASSESDSSSSDSSSCSSSDSSSSDGRKKKTRRSSKKKSYKKKRDERLCRDSPNLEVPKLTGADDYELWRTMIELKLKVQKLWEMVTEKEEKSEVWSSHRKRRWEARWLKAQEIIAGSLGPRLAGRYRRLLVRCDPVALFQEIEKEYNAGSAAKNDILIKNAMFSRKLVKGERVDLYIDAIMKMQEDLVTLGFPLGEDELARLLLTNSLEAFPDLSSELVGARLKRSVLEVGRVR